MRNGIFVHLQWGKISTVQKTGIHRIGLRSAPVFRINRQILVNRSAVVSFEPFFNRKIILHLKVKLADKFIVSRLKVSQFKEWLEK
ncbi:MAG: LytTR family transcriptional regulator DNA-binding domain-containing protein [Saprospirales bacterium]|nr:LytTR family transcriptional regulator DNA-binding domain-containing protein [Saprospirales bacterium]